MASETRSGSQVDAKSETICAQLTPRGRGAVAVIAINGPAAQSALDQHFQPVSRQTYSQTAPRKIVYGIWQSTGEDVVAFRRGSEQFEVHCHGGNSASAAIIATLGSTDIPEVSSRQFAQILDDPWQVDVQFALAQATTARSAELLLHQMELLPKAMGKIGSLIQSKQHEPAIAKLQSMLKWSKFGLHLTQPRSIVLCGRPNVGKSSLVNAIVGFQRAIVHNLPGTTRDVVSQLTAIDGWPVELKDTAGLRTATDTIEEIGIEKARTQIRSADLVIGVFDHSLPWTSDDQDMLEAIHPQLVVFNKTDLTEPKPPPIDRPSGILTSVETGDGIQTLIQQVGSRLVPSLPDADQAFPVTPEQIDKLQDLLHGCRTPSEDETPDIGI